MENMESKSKYRTIGILVIIAAAIILLILFENKSKPDADTTIAKAPPFPDQTVQIAAPHETPLEVAPAEQNDANKTESVANTQPNTPTPSTDNTPLPEPENSIRLNRPSVINSQEPPIEDKKNDNNTQKNQPTALLTDDLPAQGPKNDDFKPVKELKTPAVKKIVHVVSKKPSKKLAIVATKQKLPQHNGAELKNAAWVIQMGSFKNKENALRLVNKLRINGYKAFIHKTATASGEHSKVLVGPENKKEKAHAIANRLKNVFHIDGVIIIYKPFEL